MLTVTPLTERNEEIRRENHILYYKMTQIARKGTMRRVFSMGDAYGQGKSLNFEARRREMAKIDAENSVRRPDSGSSNSSQ